MGLKLTFKDYHQALKEGRLIGLKCRTCGTIMVPPAMTCRKCSSTDSEITTVKPQGEIRTFTTVFVAAEGREGEVPYTIVLVELDEGPWLLGRLEGIDPKADSMELIGSRVSMVPKVFGGDKYSAGEAAYPVFRLQS